MEWVAKFGGLHRIALGDPKPDPNIGKRIGPSTGMVINDAEGFERMGYGLLDIDGTYRVTLGLDSDRSTKDLVLFLDDLTGELGVSVGDRGDRILLGTAPAGQGLSSLPDPFQGLLLRRDGEIVHELNVAERNRRTLQGPPRTYPEETLSGSPPLRLAPYPPQVHARP